MCYLVLPCVTVCYLVLFCIALRRFVLACRPVPTSGHQNIFRISAEQGEHIRVSVRWLTPGCLAPSFIAYLRRRLPIF